MSKGSPVDVVESYAFDVFISHAGEDKAGYVEPLIGELRARGVRVWYDAEQILLGDDFRQRMDDGLSRARFGVVILTPRFFRYWPQAELSALFAQESVLDTTRILPVRGDLDRATLIRQSPLLGARADVGWELGVRIVAERIHDRIRGRPLARPAARSPVYNLPSRRARTFVGRAPDIERLNALLVPGSTVQVSATIEGLAGVGKTELALHLVDALARTDRFAGGIFWFDAESPDLTVAWGTTIADALAVGAGTVEERAAGALRHASSGAPVLVVLDNVESWTRATAPKPLPGGPQVALLVTTRHRFLGGPSFAHHPLEVLGEAAARELLFSVAARDLDRSPGTGELLRHLDGHSLAIELAGAYLRELPTVTPADYLRQLESGAAVEEQVQDLVRYEATVRRALDVHWTQLDPAAREALLVAASFAPEDATTDLLETCGVVAGLQQPLRRFHLMTGDGGRWRMSPLVRRWARLIASPEDLAKAKRKFIEGCVEYSRRIEPADEFRIYRANGPHLEQAVREAAEVLGADDTRVSLLYDRLTIALQAIGAAQGEPSNLDSSTLLRSSGTESEVFSHDAGVAPALVIEARGLGTMASALRFNSVFISYSSEDRTIATKLYDALSARGVRVWFAQHAMRGGQRIFDQIDEAIQGHDRLLLLLSEASIKSNWVKTELLRAWRREVTEARRVLFPVSLVPYEILKGWSCFDADTGDDVAAAVRAYFVPDLSEWTNEERFEEAVRLIIDALRASEKSGA